MLSKLMTGRKKGQVKEWFSIKPYGRIEEIFNPDGTLPSYNVYRATNTNKKVEFYKSAYNLESALLKFKELSELNKNNEIKQNI